MAEIEQEEGDAAAAFVALRAEVAGLRAEMSVMRRAMEALPGAWAESQVPDYAPDLGRITKGLGEVAGRLGVIEAHPALRLTPAQHQAAIARAGEGLLREAAHKLEHAAQESQRAGQQLGGMIGTIRAQNAQWNWVFYTGLAACVAGLLLSPMLAASLPFGWNGRIAALLMKDSRWGAGWDLLQAASPASAQQAAYGFNLVRANQDQLAACAREASKTSQPQHCMVIVQVPKE
nr:DUF6118 family protein [uncultured Acidocella sp.]